MPVRRCDSLTVMIRSIAARMIAARMMTALRATLSAAALAAAALAMSPAAFVASAQAQDCAPRGSSVGGTLSNPQASCSTAPVRRPIQPESSRSAPAQQGERGVFRHGNTTIRMGGSVSTDIHIGRR